MQLGLPYGLDGATTPSDDECIRLVRQALDMGINFIDTAAEYGRSEELVDKACAGAAPTPIICTKIALPDKSPAAVSEENLFQHLAHHLEKSRQHLQLDTLDLVKLHSLSTPFVTDELIDALASFVERGWVRYWGVTTYGLEAPLDALRYPEHFRSLQVAYSALDRTLEDTLFPAVHQAGSGLVIRSIFLQGVLTDRFNELPNFPSSITAAVAQLRALAANAGIGLAELAFRFAAYHPAVAIAIFGTTCADEVKTNAEYYAQGPLTPDLVEAIRAVKIKDPSQLHSSTWGSPN